MNTCTYVYISILLIILLIGAKFAPKGEFFEDSFSLVYSKGLQGYFAVWIIFHHLAVELKDFTTYKGEFFFFENLGVLFVGFFFFCSGYGLMVSLHSKKDYLQHFLLKRVWSVLVPFFICNYTYVIVTLIMGARYEMKDLLCSFFGILLLNNQMWFAVEIMILYLFFYVVFRVIKQEKIAITIMGVIVIAMVTISLLLGHDYTSKMAGQWFHGEWWYSTTMLFLIGMIVAKNKSKLRSIAQKGYPVLLLISFVGFKLFQMMTNHRLRLGGYWTEQPGQNGEYLDKLKTLACQLPMVIFFVFLVLLIMMRIHFTNRMLRFLGTISLEMILMNRLFLEVFYPCRIHYGVHVYLIFIMVATIASAYILHKIKLFILEKKS